MEIVRKKKPAKDKVEAEQQHNSHRRTVACLELSTRHMYRRAFSEVSLLDSCGSFDFTDGHSYHFITAGDVDSLSYLKAMLRAQDLDHCLLSTWCMSAEDILQLKNWVESGKIKKLDIYVGEIFPGSYRVEWQMLQEMYENNGEKMGGGKSGVFPQPLKNICWNRFKVRLWHRNERKCEHEPTHRTRLYNNLIGDLRLLQSVFRRSNII